MERRGEMRGGGGNEKMWEQAEGVNLVLVIEMRLRHFCRNFQVQAVLEPNVSAFGEGIGDGKKVFKKKKKKNERTKRTGFHRNYTRQHQQQIRLMTKAE